MQNAVHVLGRVAAFHVNIACEARFVLCIANKEDSFDRIKVCARQVAKGIDDCGRPLGVALKDEALQRACCKGVLDFTNDLKSGLDGIHGLCRGAGISRLEYQASCLGTKRLGILRCTIFT